MLSDYIVFAKVLRSRGGGEYFLEVYSDRQDDILFYERFYISLGSRYILLLGVSVRRLGSDLLISFGDNSLLSKWVGTLLYLRRSDLGILSSSEYYYTDIIGFGCFALVGGGDGVVDGVFRRFGILEDVVNYGGGDLFYIREDSGVRGGLEGGEGGERKKGGRKKGKRSLYLPSWCNLVKEISFSCSLIYFFDIEGFV